MSQYSRTSEVPTLLGTYVADDPAKPQHAEYTNPGLQTVPVEYSQAHGTHNTAYYSPGIEAVHQEPFIDPKLKGDQLPAYGLPPKKDPRILGVKRKWFLLGLAALIVIIIAGVVGGVMASKKKDVKVESVDSGSPDSGNNNGSGGDKDNEKDEEEKPPKLPEPTLIAQGSGLAVTGWENRGDLRMSLFFQDKIGNIIYVGYDAKEDEWQTSRPRTLTQAEPNIRLVATDTHDDRNTDDLDDIQTNIYYINEKGCLHEWVYWIGTQKSENGGLSSKCSTGSASQTSGVASYWPFIVFQGSDGALLHYKHLTGAEWEFGELGVNAIAGGSINIMPLSKRYDGISVVYQKPDRSLGIHSRENILLADRNKTETKWVATADVPDIKDLPAGANIGTLSFAPFGNSDRIHQFIVYQESSGQISFYQRTVNTPMDNDGLLSGQGAGRNPTITWKGPKTSDAFKFARKGTQIACITPYVHVFTIMAEEPAVAKCFFQLQGGQVRQVSVDSNGEWKFEKDIIL